MNKYISLVFLCLFFIPKFSYSMPQIQTNPLEVRLKSSSASKITCFDQTVCGSSLVKEFYVTNKFSPIWIKNGQPNLNATKFISALRLSYTEGLNPQSYHLDQINAMLSEIEKKHSKNEAVGIDKLVSFELTLTDAFFLYASDLAYGKINVKAAHPSWTVTKRPFDLKALLVTSLHSGNFVNSLASLDPKYQGYSDLKDALDFYQKIDEDGGWDKIPDGDVLKLKSSGYRVKLLQNRLAITGELGDIPDSEFGQFNEQLKDAVIAFQLDHGLESSGTVNKATLAALNVPVNKVIRQIELNMDRMRVLPNNMGDKYIYINIPHYYLTVFENGESKLGMPVVVGKGGKQSCVVTSKISYFEINPYWYVPDSIAKELLLEVKQDPLILEDNKIKVFKSLSDSKSEIDPKTIDWADVETSNFKYKFRQEPGPDNALGTMKFVFPNNCGIYLHYTLSPELFDGSRRDLSHGCIRIADPIALALNLLNNKDGWDQKKIESIIDTAKMKTVQLPNPINIYIVYFTNWVDESGVLQFRNDIYRLDNSNFPVALKPSSTTKVQ